MAGQSNHDLDLSAAGHNFPEQKRHLQRPASLTRAMGAGVAHRFVQPRCTLCSAPTATEPCSAALPTQQ
jgi:hypothetical protein